MEVSRPSSADAALPPAFAGRPCSHRLWFWLRRLGLFENRGLGRQALILLRQRRRLNRLIRGHLHHHRGDGFAFRGSPGLRLGDGLYGIGWLRRWFAQRDLGLARRLWLRRQRPWVYRSERQILRKALIEFDYGLLSEAWDVIRLLLPAKFRSPANFVAMTPGLPRLPLRRLRRN